MMTDAVTPDRDLVGHYAREGSESAFHALVSRYIPLVFATALRQTGDRGLAEEITQNTFIQLARKAPALTGHKTIAGWLHTTAILESKHRIRTELRRQRRELTAAELSNLHHNGLSPTEALIPLLDEGLLGLRDSERLALILRFIEGHSLRDVGSNLGISEEAARKRVDRALQRLSEFFRARGFSVTAAASTSLLSQAAPIPSLGLAGRCLASGLSAGSGGGILAKLISHGSFLTPLRSAIIGGALACLPVVVHWPQLQAERAQFQETQAQLQSEQAQLAGLRSQASDLEQQRARSLRQRSAPTGLQPTLPTTPTPTPIWDPATPWIRVPKSVVTSLDIFGVRNNLGSLSEPLIEILQLTPGEVSRIEASLRKFLEGCHEAEANGLRRVEPTEDDLQGHTKETTRVFVLPDTSQEIATLREQLLKEFSETLDPERLQLLRKSLKDWMPWDASYRGLSSSFGVHQFARRERYHPYPEQPHIPGQAVLHWSLTVQGGGGLGGTRYVDEIPDYLRPHLQDWIDEARRINDGPAKKETRQP